MNNTKINGFISKRGMWYVVCGVWYEVCGMWCVVCGVWCEVCGVRFCDFLRSMLMCLSMVEVKK